MEQIGAYDILRTIGQGSFCVVKCASKSSDISDKRNGLYALKVCRNNQLRKIKLCEYDLHGNLIRYTGLQRFERECSILKSLRHPNIISFYETFCDEEEDVTVLVTQFVPLGPLMLFDVSTQKYVYNKALVQRHNAVLEVKDVLRYFRDIVQAVAYLHRHNVCHRDIKPANILVSDNFSLVLCDFGVAEQFGPSATHQSSLCTDNTSLVHTASGSTLECNPGGLVSNTTGSPADWAPEAIFPERFNTDCGLDLSQDLEALELSENPTLSPKGSVDGESRFKIARFSAYGLDMWAMGVLLFEMFYQKHPFFRTELSELELYDRIADHDPLFSDCAKSCTCNKSTRESRGADECIRTAGESGGDSDVHIRVEVSAPDSESMHILEGLLQKEPSMRWSVDTLLSFQTFSN